MRAIRGVIITCDHAVKQILITLDERPNQSFIIEDLDEFHVLIRADEEQRVRRELEAEHGTLDPNVVLHAFLDKLSRYVDPYTEQNTFPSEYIEIASHARDTERDY
ncbi:transcription factor TFIIH complex subunit Tfb5-domain-containing protein [Russula earlei]|uniref:Transcription factor TFIIH complex subunit Tfb5-domain-containing protein n=1 Tax=Russula earlei TaxID=71964 RepID=A0ACC0UL30_9AGAM|nr:transcription factor TFIIH complex subunit Tfb5-domain-containing protein [Russula earlei]